jgi:hypothetical protein
MKNIGVIIQGPLVTYGQGPNNVAAGFNTCDTILKNIHNIQKAGFKYVVSTWKPLNEDEQIVLESLLKEKTSIVCNDAPTIFDPDHRHKQRVSILLGIQELDRQNDIDYFVKIRTDMLMPERFWNWVGEIGAKNEPRLHVSELMKQPFYMGDFIYAANRDIFIDFVNSVLKYNAKIIHPSIAFDDGIKYCQHKGCLEFEKNTFKALRVINLFSFRKNLTNRLWNDFIAAHLAVLPEEIWNDIVWRKRRIGSFLQTSNFKFDVLPLTSNQMSSAQSVIAIAEDYLKYWEKGHRYYIITKSIKMFRASASFIRKTLRFLYKKIFSRNPFVKKHIILCRSACLGHTLLNLKDPRAKNISLICQQKTRLDLFMEHVSGNIPETMRVKSAVVNEYISREDIHELIFQQEKLPWLKTKKFDYVLMDSFSEMTDKKFTHKKEGWSFFCHQSDIADVPAFEELFESHGLLDIKKFSETYEAFFSWFELSYPGKKVVFLHYPTALDERVVYKERAAEILRVMASIEKRKDYIYNVCIDESKVFQYENDDFPYHYSKETNEEFIRKWEELEHAKKQ